jgi:hypothetical protein
MLYLIHVQQKEKQMNYDNFVLYCFNEGINIDIIKAYRQAVMKDASWCLDRPKHRQLATFDLGHAELADIVTVEQGIKDIKDGIKMATIDYDALGRSREKAMIKQLIKNANNFPQNKYLVRRIAKTFYLMDGIAD